MTDSHFSSWFSGFVDGEGHFGVALSSGTRPTPRWYAHLTIAVRDDDAEVLRKIQQRFGGRLNHVPPLAGSRSRPVMRWRVASVSECVALVEHFETYPLLAKKRRDFEIWALAVRHMHEFKGAKGTPKSSKVDNDYLAALSLALREVRRYGSDGVQPSTPELVLVSKGA